MVKIRSLREVAIAAVLAAAVAACGGKNVSPTQAETPHLGMSVQVGGPQAAAGDLLSPASVTVRVPDTDGTGGTLVAVEATFRNADHVALAEGKWTREEAIPANGTAEAALELSWSPPTAAARSLDLRVSVRDSAGALHVLSVTIVGVHNGEWMAM